MEFKKTVRDIKSLKIQGAENIAKQAVMSIKDILKKNEKSNSEQLINELQKAKKILFEARPTEPCMRNAINFVFSFVKNQDDRKEIIRDATEGANKALEFFGQSERKITEYGSQKIKDLDVIYTHCHSSTVIRIIKAAWKQGKHIEVHNTETRPLYQGRITAKELAKEGIPVTIYVDSAARAALKKSDIMLIGADAITSEGRIINKIGSELFAEVANRYDVPVYACSNSWKFDPQTLFGFEEKIEKRHSTEIWRKPPKNIKISNFAFEIINPDLITGVITEAGIYKPQNLVQILQKNNSWMFNN